MGARDSLGAGTSFRVWAPDHSRVAVVLEHDPAATNGPVRSVELEPEKLGHFHICCEDVVAGTRYRFRLDDDQELVPDPASRYQPQGPFGPSEVVDPASYAWSDHDWPGISMPGQVLYEMHVGTFTQEGTWAAATRELAELARLGITVLEIMPIADFAGEFGWSYDGVNFFAPTRVYGTPDDMRRFVDEAHRVGLG